MLEQRSNTHANNAYAHHKYTGVHKNHVVFHRGRSKIPSTERMEKHPVSRLQEISQQWKLPIPSYRESEGTYQLFGTEVTITLDGEMIAFSALGRNKKDSKTKAAEKALDYVKEYYPNLLEPPPLPVRGRGI